MIQGKLFQEHDERVIFQTQHGMILDYPIYYDPQERGEYLDCERCWQESCKDCPSE